MLSSRVDPQDTGGGDTLTYPHHIMRRRAGIPERDLESWSEGEGIGQ
ncbi:MAG: hypothetical protein AVDCRST_MAG34-1937 [uncultured Nocardioidaceae bacterium]|uniref:Uncharacterized protein n=1 Tax=uncultured Nocardioidaceae bacterium TaxID=253824 RepID=A0A6J4M9J2_9ACTN|nr:MAG: hypothetical protein AVDCRST_MAG34-1937 [uncultured Nocardioidaceae bacterium]